MQNRLKGSLTHLTSRSDSQPCVTRATRSGFLTLLVLLMSSLVVHAEDTPNLGKQFAEAIMEKDVDEIKTMLEAGAPPDTLIEYTDYKVTPLIKAAEDGDAEIVELLLAAGADINARSTDSKETALLKALRGPHVAVIRKLLEHKADVGLGDAYGNNPFISAVLSGNIEVAEMLLDSGADIEKGMDEAGGFEGVTPLMFAFGLPENEREMIRFLVKKGADVNGGADKGSETPLVLAAKHGRVDAVKVLIELKADVNAKTKDGDTPLKAAKRGKQEQIIAILKKAGAKG